MQNIQLFEPKYRVEECLAQIRICLEKGWTGLGFKTIEFEDAWSKYTGLNHSHFLSSATAGLHLSLRILKDHHNWAEGDEIITTPFTFVSTNHAILYERLTPVFADIDEYLCLDPESVLTKINKRTRAVLFVGIGGNSGQLSKIREICQSKGLHLILDAAHMAGTRIDKQHAGHNCDVSIFSFHSVKNLPTADGGMICFKEAIHDEYARKLSWLGISKDTFTRTVDPGTYKWRYEVDALGFKYHGNSIMAAIGLVSLMYLDQDNDYRRLLAHWYQDRLNNMGIKSVPVPSNCESSRHLFQVLVPNRDQILLSLNKRGIMPGVHYRDNTEYPMYKYAHGTCPKAANASNQVISLPMHLNLLEQDVDRVCLSLKQSIEEVAISTPKALCP